MKERNKAVPAVYLLLRRGDEIVLTLRKNAAYYDGWWVVPSGHVEEGELPIDAMVREAREEVGVEVDRSSIRFVHALYRTKDNETGDRADYFFETSEWRGEPINAEPEKCSEVRWFSLRSLPENTMHHVRDALACIEKRIPYSELDSNQQPRIPS